MGSLGRASSRIVVNALANAGLSWGRYLVSYRISNDDFRSTSPCDEAPEGPGLLGGSLVWIGLGLVPIRLRYSTCSDGKLFLAASSSPRQSTRGAVGREWQHLPQGGRSGRSRNRGIRRDSR